MAELFRKKAVHEPISSHPPYVSVLDADDPSIVNQPDYVDRRIDLYKDLVISQAAMDDTWTFNEVTPDLLVKWLLPSEEWKKERASYFPKTKERIFKALMTSLEDIRARATGMDQDALLPPAVEKVAAHGDKKVWVAPDGQKDYWCQPAGYNHHAHYALDLCRDNGIPTQETGDDADAVNAERSLIKAGWMRMLPGDAGYAEVWRWTQPLLEALQAHLNGYDAHERMMLEQASDHRRSTLSVGEIQSLNTANDLIRLSSSRLTADRKVKDSTSFKGLSIAIEYPEGSTRKGTAPDGTKWERPVIHPYGYIKKTDGADGDSIDCYVGPSEDSDLVYVVNQFHPDGKFDEHKVLLGFDDAHAALTGYLAHMPDDWAQFGPLQAFTLAEFKHWLQTGDTSKTASEKPKAVWVLASEEAVDWMVLGTLHGVKTAHAEPLKPKTGEVLIRMAREAFEEANAPVLVLGGIPQWVLRDAALRVPAGSQVGVVGFQRVEDMKKRFAGRASVTQLTAGYYDPTGNKPGKLLSENPKYQGQHVYIYRGLPEAAGPMFNPNDYVCLGRKFAEEHADTTAVYEEEPCIAIKAFVPAEHVAEAYNPGEYFYVGPKPIKGRVIYKFDPETGEGVKLARKKLAGFKNRAWISPTGEVHPVEGDYAGMGGAPVGFEHHDTKAEALGLGSESEALRSGWARVGTYTERTCYGAYFESRKPTDVQIQAFQKMCLQNPPPKREGHASEVIFEGALDGSMPYDVFATLNNVADVRRALMVKTAANAEKGPDTGDHGATTDDSGQFWGDAGAGCVFLAQDTGRLLISFRSEFVNEPHTWGVWGGAIDGKENPAQAALREVREETGYRGQVHLKEAYVYTNGKFKYTTFLAIVPKEFVPRLDWETEDFQWCDREKLPNPIHFGLKEALPSVVELADEVRPLGSKENDKLKDALGQTEHKESSFHTIVVARYHGKTAATIENGVYSMPLSEAVDEHEKLTDALRSPGKADDAAELKEQGGELKDMQKAQADQMENFYDLTVRILRMGTPTFDDFVTKLRTGAASQFPEYLKAAGGYTGLRHIWDETHGSQDEDARQSMDMHRISPRKPSAVANPRGKAREVPLEDPHTENKLQPDLESMARDPETFAHNIGLMLDYPNFQGIKKANATLPQKVEMILDQMVDNLVWLYNHWSPDFRKRTKLWYVGGNRLIHRWTRRFHADPHQVAAVIAALSPQQPWFQNITLAERVLSAVKEHPNFKWDDKMTKLVLHREWGSKPSGKLPSAKSMLAELQGKSLNDLRAENTGDSLYKQAVWVRAWDEAHNPNKLREVSPEGEFGDWDRTDKGVPARVQWKSFAMISKAIKAIESPTAREISDIVGENHKVRSFYNNLIAPHSKGGDVTIDTHAVAAALLRPLSAASREVSHNFGGGLTGEPGTSDSKVTGATGLYGIYAEAYRRAAAKVGVQPRELQSITWEAVRGLFEAKIKGTKGQETQDLIQQTWEDVSNGRRNPESARERISDLAGGIATPSWSRSHSAGHEVQRDSSYAGELPGDGPSGGEPGGLSGGAGSGAARGASAKGVKARLFQKQATAWFGKKVWGDPTTGEIIICREKANDPELDYHCVAAAAILKEREGLEFENVVDAEPALLKKGWVRGYAADAGYLQANGWSSRQLHVGQKIMQGVRGFIYVENGVGAAAAMDAGEFCAINSRNELLHLFRAKLTAKKASGWTIPPKLAKHVQVVGDLSAAKQWHAKVWLGNSGTSDQTQVTIIGFDPGTGTIVPIAASDEHKNGWDLIRYLKAKKVIPDLPFQMVFLDLNYADRDHLPEQLALYTAWRRVGGPNTAVRSRYIEPGFLVSMDDFIAAKGNVDANYSGRLSTTGARLIKALDALKTSYERWHSKGLSDRKGLVRNAISAMEALNHMQFAYVMGHQDLEHARKALMDLEAGADPQEFEQAIFSFNGLKNQIHNALRQFGSNQFKDRDLQEAFGDVSLAKQEFDRLGAAPIPAA